MPERLSIFGNKLRWSICGLLFFATTVNYVDRQVLGILKPVLEKELGWKDTDYGWVIFTFQLAYALMMPFAGRAMDWLGTRAGYAIAVAVWSVASMCHSLASTPMQFAIARFGLGIGESSNFPAAVKTVADWFPRKERASSTALFDAAAKFSNVVGVPLVALAVVNLGWRWGFGLVAAFSFAYFAAFYGFYRDPSAHAKLSATERDYIAAGGATPEGQLSASPAGMLRHLLRSRKVWGLSIGFAAYGYCFYLFLTWLPGYLVQTMHMSILKSATFAAIPWMCATISDLLVGGWLIDHLIARGYDETRVRKTVLLAGMFGGLAVFGATTTTDPVKAIIWISVALSGLAAAAPVGWSLPSLIAPRGGVGTVGGIMNFANNLMGAVAPIITGMIVGKTQSFANAFLVAGVVLLVGIAAFVFLLGRIEPVGEP